MQAGGEGMQRRLCRLAILLCLLLVCSNLSVLCCDSRIVLSYDRVLFCNILVVLVYLAICVCHCIVV